MEQLEKDARNEAEIAEKGINGKDITPKMFIRENSTELDLTDDEKIDIAAASILQRFMAAFEELAK